MKTLPTYILALCLLLAAANAQAGPSFRLEQDTGDGYEFVSNVSVFTTQQSLFDFYSSSDSPSADFEGITDTIANSDLLFNRSHIFLIDSVIDGLGLVVVHNKAGNDFASAGEAEMAMSFAGQKEAWIARKDDDRDSPTAHYTWDYISGTSTVYAQWAWGTGRTDGIAVAWSPGAGDAATIQFADLDRDSEVPTDPSGPTQTYQTHSNLTSWAFYDPDNLSSGGQALSLAQDQPIRLTMLPLPPASWPAVAMLGALALRKLRTRRLSQSEQLR